MTECVPRRLRAALPGHDVSTVHEMGWSGKTNGELLQLAVGQGFEVLLTVDHNLPHQQTVAVAGIAVLVLVALTNRLADLLPLAPHALTALASIQPGEVVEVGL